MGIDPGLVATGYAALARRGAALAPIGSGCVKTSSADAMPTRLRAIYAGLSEAVERLRPDVVAIEELHSVARFARVAILMAQARGVAMLVAAEHRLPVLEFRPTAAKNVVTGFGRATKEQVQRAVAMRLGLAEPVKNEHVADAFALAICGALSPETRARRGQRERVMQP